MKYSVLFPTSFNLITGPHQGTVDVNLIRSINYLPVPPWEQFPLWLRVAIVPERLIVTCRQMRHLKPQARSGKLRFFSVCFSMVKSQLAKLMTHSIYWLSFLRDPSLTLPHGSFQRHNEWRKCNIKKKFACSQTRYSWSGWPQQGQSVSLWVGWKWRAFRFPSLVQRFAGPEKYVGNFLKLWFNFAL